MNSIYFASTWQRFESIVWFVVIKMQWLVHSGMNTLERVGVSSELVPQRQFGWNLGMAQWQADQLEKTFPKESVQRGHIIHCVTA